MSQIRDRHQQKIKNPSCDWSISIARFKHFVVLLISLFMQALSDYFKDLFVVVENAEGCLALVNSQERVNADQAMVYGKAF